MEFGGRWRDKEGSSGPMHVFSNQNLKKTILL